MIIKKLSESLRVSSHIINSWLASAFDVFHPLSNFMYKQVEKELSEIKKPEEDRLKKAFERLDVDRDGELPPGLFSRANILCCCLLHNDQS